MLAFLARIIVKTDEVTAVTMPALQENETRSGRWPDVVKALRAENGHMQQKDGRAVRSSPARLTGRTLGRILLLSWVFPATPLFAQLSFAPPTTYALTAPINAMATGDLTGDGLPDLVAVSNQKLEVLINNGDNTLSVVANPGPVGGARMMTVGDFDGDGLADVALASQGRAVTILLSRGDGTFKSVKFFGVGEDNIFATALVTGDFSHSGHLDLALVTVGLFGSAPNLLIFKNQGDGTFIRASSIGLTDGGISVIAPDVNADGYFDLVTANGNTNGTPTVSVFLNSGNGTFATRTNYVTNGARDVIAGDLNNDGYVDLVLSGAATLSLGVMLNNGNGSFSPPAYYSTGYYPVSAAVADFDGDGNLDVSSFIVGGDPNPLVILRGNGDGTLQARATVATFPSHPGSEILSIDLDLNGAVDLIMSDNAQNPTSPGVHVVINQRLPPIDHGLRLSTYRGGNAGTVTVTMFRRDLQAGSTVELVCDGQSDIIGTNVVVGVDGTSLTTTFNLVGAFPGLCNVVLTKPDGTAKYAAKAFTIEHGGEAGLSVIVLGPGVVRFNRDNSFVVLVHNHGSNDVPFVTVETEIQPALQVTGVHAAAAAARTLPYFIPVGGSITIPHVFRPDSVQCWRMRAEAEEEEECDPEEIEAALQELEHQLAQVRGELSSLETNYASLNCDDVLKRGPLPDPFTWVACLRWRSRLIELRAEKARLVAQIEFAKQQLEECLRRHERQGASSLVTAVALTAITSAPASGSGSADFCTVTSWDPNDKIGVGGVGPHRYVAPNVPLPYTIHFENQATATAPAAEVVLEDYLDPSLDWASVTFGTVTFGDRVVEVPSIPGGFRSVLDLRPDKEILLDIEGSVSSSGLLRVRLTSLDPLTGQPPNDPFVGFLPPNVNSPEGEGSVSFTVSTKSNVPHGTQIGNRASIIFDANPALVTPEWTNVIDAMKPESRVLQLDAIQQTSTFVIAWSGSDEGSGLNTFSVFVSDNGGPFSPFQTHTAATSATFTGEHGHTYSFYSIARDLVGNSERPKTSAETTTEVLSDTTPPSIIGLRSPDPNANGWNNSAVTVSFECSDPSGLAPGNPPPPTIVTADGRSQSVTGTCTDLAGNPASLTVSDINIDKTLPLIAVSANPSTLWPPNRKLVTTVLSGSMTDALSGIDPTSAMFRVVDEYGRIQPSGQISLSPDGSYFVSVALEASRVGQDLDGRGYQIMVSGKDRAGNTASASVGVTVPHDRR